MLDVIHENRGLLVLNKPSGFSLFNDRSGAPDLWTEIVKNYPSAKPVHRLDKGTSGVLVVALARAAQVEISRMLAARVVGKHYLGLACGHLPVGRTLTIDLPLKPGRKRRFRVAGLREAIRSDRTGWHIDSADGHQSITRIRCLRWVNSRSLISIKPLTGRSHQVRVHLSWIGHAVAGDRLYGAPGSTAQEASRLMLHCHRMVLPGIGSFKAETPIGLASLGLNPGGGPRLG